MAHLSTSSVHSCLQVARQSETDPQVPWSIHGLGVRRLIFQKLEISCFRIFALQVLLFGLGLRVGFAFVCCVERWTNGRLAE